MTQESEKRLLDAIAGNFNLTDYFKSCNAVKRAFIKKYFDITPTDTYWIAGECGGTLAVNDYFIDLRTMVECLKHKVTPDQLWEWYDHSVARGGGLEDGVAYTLINWVKINKK